MQLLESFFKNEKKTNQIELKIEVNWRSMQILKAI
jgi:hypothetical protein